MRGSQLERGERARSRKGPLITDLRTRAVHDTWVSLELDPGRCDNRPELLSRQGPKPYWNHGVQLPMTLKDGQVLGTAIGCLWARQDLQGKANASAQLPSHRSLNGQKWGCRDTHLGEGPVQRQPTAQCDNASQRVGTGKGRVEGQGPTLEGGENERS